MNQEKVNDESKRLDLSVWSTIEDCTDTEIKEVDELWFFEQSKRFREEIKSEDDLLNMSKTNLIEGLWWSGKTSFLNMMLWQIKNDKEFLKWKNVVPVFFTPRYIVDPKDFFKSFFDALRNTLLQKKYNEGLVDTTKDFLSLVDWVDDSWVTFFKNIFSYFLPQKNWTINATIDELEHIFSKDYSDYFIVLVIDEVDRIWVQELQEFSKILDIAKQLADRCQNLIVFCWWDQRYMEKLMIPWQIWVDQIHFQEFLQKFFDDFWHTHFADDALHFLISDSLRSLGVSTELSHIKVICDKLNELRYFVVIRNLKRHLKKLKKYFNNLHSISYKRISEDLISQNERSKRKFYDGQVFSFYLEFFYRLTLFRFKSNDISKAYEEMLGHGYPIKGLYDEKKRSLKEDYYYKSLHKFKLWIPLFENTSKIKSDTLFLWFSNVFKPMFLFISNLDRDFFQYVEILIFYEKIAGFISSSLNSAKEWSLAYKQYLFQWNIRADAWNNWIMLTRFQMQKLNTDFHKYFDFLKYLLELLKEPQVIDFIRLWTFISWENNLVDVTDVIVEVYHRYVEKWWTLNNESYIKEFISLFDDKPLERFFLLKKLYALSIAKNNSWYSHFEKFCHEFLDVDVNDTQVWDFDLTETVSWSKYLWIYFLKMVFEFWEEWKLDQIISEKLETLNLSIHDVELIQLVRQILGVFYGDRLLKKEDQERFIEQLFSDKMKLQILFSMIQRDPSPYWAESHFVFSRDTYSNDVLKKLAELFDQQELYSSTNLYIFKTINSKVQLAEVTWEEKDAVRDELKNRISQITS